VVGVLQYLPFVMWLALLIYCLIDIDQSPPTRVRRMSPGAWLLVVVLVPVVGCIAWLVLGRPAPVHGVTPAAVGPALEMLEGPDSSDRPGYPVVQDRSLQETLARIDREFDEAVRRSLQRMRSMGKGDPPAG
jgi:hypothetical protein